VTPRLLLLGGLDPCGGAGITADAVVAAAHGVQALPVAVAFTAQNRRGFRGCHEVPERWWRDALESAIGEGELHAVKLGLLGNASTVAAVAAALRPLRERVPIVVDPVLSATAGGYEAPAEVARAYRQHLLPLAALFVPNADEANAVHGGDPAAALAAGCAAVLCKGGHGGGEFADDVLHLPGGRALRFRRPRLPVGPVHGTGCALASAIGSWLARGCNVETACVRAGEWLHSLLAAMGPPAADGLPRPLPLWRDAVSDTSSR
jgi:hydroxymethylpyrimidine kinase/phosphomethylpyrimidine kinase